MANTRCRRQCSAPTSDNSGPGVIYRRASGLCAGNSSRGEVGKRATRILSVGGFKLTVPDVLHCLYPPLHASLYTLRHLSRDCDLLTLLKTARIDVIVGPLERLGRFTKTSVQAKRDCRTAESNALSANMTMDHVDPYHRSSTGPFADLTKITIASVPVIHFSSLLHLTVSFHPLLHFPTHICSLFCQLDVLNVTIAASLTG
ncbi:hypothetical protein AMAG_11141 [Allomyces macrogynus ATCC 38327]|uniref:Uncharacterized protein n=1 Tax=Allomyces macrogynus (strain ATCC 38327) TaxID=578462 RepID=A0A0L0ST20_ALLM3|nr:hypothetical protein AMAG_11141 [Allomyces macrogynus ATCC 38327]|eukprot:KNE65525.1 hypothetical protein AMAG_11141 [Allomyces macrogynus ATCC 38327]